MGYTHYWDRKRLFPRPHFAAAVDDCRSICQALGIPLGDADGQNHPVFSERELCFNGQVLGPNGDGSYETFHVERVFHALPGRRSNNGWWFGFCKTEHRSYDLCVQCCLIVLAHHLGNGLIRVDSDGTSADWDRARAECQRVLGYGDGWGEGKLAPVAAATQPTAAGPPTQ